MNDKDLPLYWTDDLQGLSVFGIIKKEVEDDPGMLTRIKIYIRELETEIEKEQKSDTVF